MILAVSGIIRPPDPTTLAARDLYMRAADYIDEKLEQPTELMTGCAYGIDTDSINVFLTMWEIEKLHLVIPAAPFNAAWVSAIMSDLHPDITNTRVLAKWMPRRDQPAAAAYMERNDYMANNADALIAFPHTSVEQLRSGTWATVRRFEKRDKPVIYCPVA